MERRGADKYPAAFVQKTFKELEAAGKAHLDATDDAESSTAAAASGSKDTDGGANLAEESKMTGGVKVAEGSKTSGGAKKTTRAKKSGGAKGITEAKEITEANEDVDIKEEETGDGGDDDA